MREIESKLTEATAALSVVTSRMFDGHALPAISDDQLLAVLTSLGEASRRIEAALVVATGEVVARSLKTAAKPDRLTVRRGCTNVNELLRRTTRVSARTAKALEHAADATAVESSIVTGEKLPAKLPQLRSALRDGETGLDGIDAIARPVAEIEARVGFEAREAADAFLADLARGESDTGEPPACAETLRRFANALTVYLDPDGAEPRERAVMRKRSLTLVPGPDGLVALKALLLPEAAGQLQRLLDSQLNPAARPEFRPTSAPDTETGGTDTSGTETGGSATVGEALGDDAAPLDDRTPAQRGHDAFATAIGVAARSDELPLLGGAAPTLVVTVRERDLVTNSGYAHVDGVQEPVSLSAARHVACIGVVQRVVQNDAGRVVGLETRDRIFNAHQRRAIVARDGGCIIPGCTVLAAWCEIHHVTEHAYGGATHTDNGVTLCYHHHRSLDSNGWHVRMRDGVPQVLAPQWWDPLRQWRNVTKNPTAMISPKTTLDGGASPPKQPRAQGRSDAKNVGESLADDEHLDTQSASRHEAEGHVARIRPWGVLASDANDDNAPHRHSTQSHRSDRGSPRNDPTQDCNLRGDACEDDEA